MIIVYRAMREDKKNKGKPELGETSNTLGVRPNVDIQIHYNEIVHPETGGMSVTPDDYKQLPKHRLPRKLGGKGRHPVFKLKKYAVPFFLILRQDRSNHALVEPSKPCSFNVYKKKLHGTQKHWEKV